MDNEKVYLVCAVTPLGIGTIYAVFEDRKDAEEAREAIIAGIDEYADIIGNWDELVATVGSLDESIQVRDYPIRKSFSGDVENLWGDDWEGQ